jgi:hypothetical protein
MKHIYELKIETLLLFDLQDEIENLKYHLIDILLCETIEITQQIQENVLKHVQLDDHTLKKLILYEKYGLI